MDQLIFFVVVHVICQEREGFKGHRCQTLRCSWSVWLTANLCNATILLLTPAVPFSTIGLILIDVDSVLSHIPFTLMLPHLLQISEISPERYIHFFGTGEQLEGLSPINWDV